MRRAARQREYALEDELFQFYSDPVESCPAGRLAGSLIPIYSETRLLSGRESAARTERELTSIGRETSAIQGASWYREVKDERDGETTRERGGEVEI